MNRLAEVATACATLCAISGGSSIASLLISETAHAEDAALPTNTTAGNRLPKLSLNQTSKIDSDSGKIPTDIIFGPVVIPGNFMLSRNRDVLGSAAISGFIGAQLGTNIIDVSPAANHLLAGWGIGGFLGFSQNIGEQTNASANATAQNAGATYGAAITRQLSYFDSLNSTLHFMVFLGFDHVANNQHYQYNDKPWISVTLGTGF